MSAPATTTEAAIFDGSVSPEATGPAPPASKGRATREKKPASAKKATTSKAAAKPAPKKTNVAAKTSDHPSWKDIIKVMSLGC